MSESLIEKLEKRKEKLNKQIRDAKRKEAKINAVAYKIKCELIGDALIKEMKENIDIKHLVKEAIDKHIKKDKNKKLVDFESL